MLVYFFLYYIGALPFRPLEGRKTSSLLHLHCTFIVHLHDRLIILFLLEVHWS